VLGYVSRNNKVKIPWRQVNTSQSSWIEPECTPDKFTWTDPSKLTIEEVLLVLEHWMEREKQNLQALIWVPSCPILEYVEPRSENSESSSDLDTDADSNCGDRVRFDDEGGDGDDDRHNRHEYSPEDGENIADDGLTGASDRVHEDHSFASPPLSMTEFPRTSSGMIDSIFNVLKVILITL
jgi:hypothetical protein